MKLLDSSAKTNWKFLWIVVVLGIVAGVIFVWLEAMFFDTRSSPKNEIPPTPQDLASCAINEECVIVPYQDCCASKRAINEKYEQDYLESPEWQEPPQERRDLCALIECDDTARDLNYAKCENGQCQLVSELPSVDTSTWQTYRNEGYGFEVRYPKEFEEYGYTQEINSFSAQSLGTRQSFHIRVIAGQASFRGYIDEIDRLRATAYEGGSSVVVLRRVDTEVAGRSAIEREIQLLAAGLVGIETFVDMTPRVIISLSTREGEYKGAEVDESLRQLHTQILSTFRFVDTTACAPVGIEGYNYLFPASGNASILSGQTEIDLDGDGQDEIIRVYKEASIDYRSKPVVVKVFSGTEDCPREVFSYQSGNSDLHNEFSIGPQTFFNFWNDNSNAVFVSIISTGYGSGSREQLIFLTYQNGSYKMIQGPKKLGGEPYKFAGENGLGTKIIVAERRYDPFDPEQRGWLPGNYCAGCSSRMQFIIYTWNGASYDKKEAGITQYLYLSEGIDEILQKEPDVLNVQ